MKRLISAILTVVLLFGLAASGTAEREDSFFPALAQWASSLNLNQNDLEGRLKWEPETDFGMTLRQENGTLEADLENLGRIQVSSSRAAGEFSGQKYIVELGSLANMVMNMANEGNQYKKDAEMLSPWLQKALVQILMPCVKSMEVTYSGTNLQIYADSAAIRDHLCDFVDEMMQEEETLRTLLDHYGSTLTMVIPGMYTDFGRMKADWDRAKEQRWDFWPSFQIEADVNIQMSWGSVSAIVCRSIVVIEESAYSFDFEYTLNRDKLEMRASCRPRGSNRINAYTGNQAMEFVLSFTNAGGMDGRLVLGAEEYIAHLETAEKDDRFDVTGRVIIKDQYEGFRYPMQFLFNGRLMKESGIGNVTVDKVLNPGNRNEIKTRVLDVDMQFSRDEISGMVMAEGNLFDFRIQSGSVYSVIQVNRQYDGTYEKVLDFSHMSRSRGSGSIQFETSLIRDIRGMLFRIDYGKNSFETKVTRGPIQMFHLNSALKYRDRRVSEAVFEYYNRFIGNPLRTVPVSLKISQDDVDYNLYNIEADFPAGRDYVTGKARIFLDRQGSIREFDADVTTEATYGSGRKTKYRAYTENGDIVFESPYEIWRLTIRENSAGRFNAVLLQNGAAEVGEIILELDQAGGFSGEIRLEGSKKGTLTLHPIRKSGIVPIDSANALVIDEQFLRSIMDGVMEAVSGR